eukprot:SAG11_NODE_3682_length_2287_cov_3.219835_4_plen_53_part_00
MGSAAGVARGGEGNQAGVSGAGTASRVQLPSVLVDFDGRAGGQDPLTPPDTH